MRGIGAMARDSGLSISALRFYDGAGIFAPAWVDPDTGYRWYDDGQVTTARLIARLRRVGMPLAEIALLLESQHARPIVDTILDAHLHRLETGLRDARHELSRIRAHLDHREPSMTTPTTLTATATDLAAALKAVRFAASSDPELPMLGGVLFDITDGEVTVVATDRFRLAIASLASPAVAGPDVSALLPNAFVDELLARLITGQVVLEFTGGRLEVTLDDGGRITTPLADHDYPDYRRLVDNVATPQRIAISVADLRAAVTRAELRSLADGKAAVLTIASDGSVATGPAGEGEGLTEFGINREFLLEALDATAAAGVSQLVLGLDSPISPVVLSEPQRPGALTLLMPIRLTADASAD